MKASSVLLPPRLRTDEERSSASWLELFFDLVFVVAIAQLGLVLAYEKSRMNTTLSPVDEIPENL